MVETDSKVIEKMKPNNIRSDASSKLQGKKMVEFVGEVKQELKKVEWTSKEELSVYTKLVLASTFIFGMLIYFIDLIIQGALDGINILLKAIIG